MKVPMPAVIVVGALVVAAGSGGLVRNPDGSINPGETLTESADIAGDKAGHALDRGFQSAGEGVGSAVGSSNVLKVGVAAGALGAGWKLGDAVHSRYSVCWQRKSCDGTPTPEPTTVDRAPLLSQGFQIDVQGR